MRGISLETVVGLIIAILAAAVVLLLVFSSGLMANFTEQVQIFEIILFAYLRIAVVNVLNWVMFAVAMLLMIIMAISAIKSLKAAKSIIKDLGATYEENPEGLSMFQRFKLWSAYNAGGIQSVLGFAVFISYLIFTSFVYSHIPFYASTINVHLGSDSHPYNISLVNDEIANRIDTTWKIMGQNQGNPLQGLSDKPNPFPVFVIFPHMKGSTNMSNVYQSYVKRFGKPNYDIYVFCNVSKGIIGDLNPQEKLTCNAVSWVTGSSCNKTLITTYEPARQCIIDNKSEVFIEYADLYQLPVIGGYGGPRKDNNCPYFEGVGKINKDAIVICIKEINR